MSLGSCPFCGVLPRSAASLIVEIARKRAMMKITDRSCLMKIPPPWRGHGNTRGNFGREGVGLWTARIGGSVRTGSFFFQQFLLAFNPPSIPGKGAVAADYAMAGNCNRHRIRRAGPSNCPDCRRRADLLRDFAVAARLST